MDKIIILLIGMFIGWNAPQPKYAKDFQAFAVDKWNEYVTKPIEKEKD